MSGAVEPTIETVTPGEMIGGYEFDLRAGEFPEYVDTGAIDPVWLRLPDGRQAAPHSVLFEVGNRTFSTRYLSGRKLNAGVHHVFFAPVVPPVHIAGSVEVLATYIKRGREHVEFTARVHDGDGLLLMESHNHWVMNTPVRHEEDRPPPSPVLPASTLRRPSMAVSARGASMAAGEELPDFSRTAVLNEPEGGYGEDSVHSDGYAQRVLGLRGAVVLGSSNLGYVNELLGRQFGPSWLERGALDVRFIGSVIRDDEVTAHARVAGRVRDDSGERVELDVSLTDHTGGDVETIVGRASYLL